MKPRTKFQQQVLAASQSLPVITKEQAEWAVTNCFSHIGRRKKNNEITCMECGASWKSTAVLADSVCGCTCPKCGMELTIVDTRKRVFRDYEYFCIITTCNDFQVLRFFYLDMYAKAGEKIRYCVSEVIQSWIARGGKHATIARLRALTSFRDTWNFQSALEIRPERPLYNAIPTCVYPEQDLLPELQRSGYSGEFYGMTPFEMFKTLLTESRAETLLKAGQTKLLKYFAIKNDFRVIDEYWPSIRICMRNRYIVNDAAIWCDYINLLNFFGKDLHNAQYVCPADLNAEHDRYVQKKRDFQEKERQEERRKKALESEAIFHQAKKKFFGIQFTDGVIQVQVLESVEEIMQEGDILHHCVFASGYHLKPDSLILSASVNGQKIETVEISLSKMKVVQSRGVCNKATEFHDRIIKLVGKNMALFYKCKVA